MTTKTDTNLKALSTYSEPPRARFEKFSKRQLIERLEYADYMIIAMSDVYQAMAAKADVFSRTYGYERGYASAMNSALRWIRQGPTRSQADSVAKAA